MNEYISFLIFLFFVFFTFFLVELFSSTVKNKILGYKEISEGKLEPYESGMLYKDSPYKRYGVRVFPFLLLFLLFDIEAALLFPFIFEAKKFGIFATIELILFLFILFIGYFYILRKRGLDL
ncbi:MAG: NADH-quinone oxidoreductase subunit A [candidate division WOR-3 bacterium]